MKKVGIITMHRPVNYGSALQTYALQYIISKMGYECEIIDYRYPNELHLAKKNRVLYLLQLVLSYLINSFYGFPNIRQKRKFKRFLEIYINLSRSYTTFSELHETPPSYDIYVTGSDQVWNPKFTKGDTSFLLSFVDNTSKKISYASSFAITQLPSTYRNDFHKYLKDYSFISVREKSSIPIVQELLGSECQLVCDPTLLLKRDDYLQLGSKSNLDIKEDYILVYILRYSFDPYPNVQNLIDQVQDYFQMKVIYLNGSKNNIFCKNKKIIKHAGPCDFLYLLLNAKFVITSSFHGVVFSVNFKLPFYAIVKKGNNDSRIIDFLQTVGLLHRAVNYNEGLDSNTIMKDFVSDKIELFRNSSVSYLYHSLKS